MKKLPVLLSKHLFACSAILFSSSWLSYSVNPEDIKQTEQEEWSEEDMILDSIDPSGQWQCFEIPSNPSQKSEYFVVNQEQNLKVKIDSLELNNKGQLILHPLMMIPPFENEVPEITQYNDQVPIMNFDQESLNLGNLPEKYFPIITRPSRISYNGTRSTIEITVDISNPTFDLNRNTEEE